jgi:IS30 family transposase
MLDWSPKQISGWLKTQYSDDESLRAPHEAIYRSLFIQARGTLKKELLDHLRGKPPVSIVSLGKSRYRTKGFVALAVNADCVARTCG